MQDKERAWQIHLSYWGHGKLQRWTRNGIAKVELILLGETLILRVGRSAVLRDEGVHRDVVCPLVFSDCDGFRDLKRNYQTTWYLAVYERNGVAGVVDGK